MPHNIVLSRLFAFLVLACAGGLVGFRPCQGPPLRATALSLTTADVIVLRNAGALLPLQRLDTLRLATIKAQATAVPRVGLDFSWYLPRDVADYAPTIFFAGPQPPDLVPLCMLVVRPRWLALAGPWHWRTAADADLCRPL